MGWAPNGRLIYNTEKLGVVTTSTPPISTRNIASLPPTTQQSGSIAPQSSAITRIFPDRYLLELLQTHLTHSSLQGQCFALKNIDANIQSNIKICDPGNQINSTNNAEKQDYQQHLYLVWTLVYALWGKIPDSIPSADARNSSPSSSPTSPLITASGDSGDRLPSHTLRKLLLSKWLSQALLVPVEESVKTAKANGNSILAILHHLTGRQISPAVALAQRSRDYRLAVLLTQTWTSATVVEHPNRSMEAR